MTGGSGQVMASERPLVTVAIPTYNRADGYLRLALESALAQDYAPLEVVVSDNCSTDATTAVVQSYRDARLRYFRQSPAIPPNDNFNFCLQQARGRYVLMLHDDDLIDSDFVSACMAAGQYRGDIGVIRTGVRIIDGRGNAIGQAPNNAVGLATPDFFLAWFAGRTGMYMCNTLYNTDKLREIGGLRSRHNVFQDGIATVTIAARFGRIDVPDVKASFRVHAGEMTRAAKVRQWCEDSRDLLETMCGYAGDRKEEVATRGRRFFATVNYSRAGKVKALHARIAAFGFVFRFFGYRYLPPWRLVLASTALYRLLRSAKRRALGRPEWVA